MHHRGFFDLRHGRHHDFNHHGPFGVWRPHHFHHHGPPDWPRRPFGHHGQPRIDGNHEEQIRRIVREFFERPCHHGPERRGCGPYSRTGGRHVEFDNWRGHGRTRPCCSCNRERMGEQTRAGSSCDNLPRCPLRRHAVPCPEHSVEGGTLPGGKEASRRRCGRRSRCINLRRTQKCCCGKSCRFDGGSDQNKDLPTSAADETETDRECETTIIDLDNDAENSKKGN